MDDAAIGAVHLSNEYFPNPSFDDLGMDLRGDGFCLTQDHLSPLCIAPSSRRCSLTIEPLGLDPFSCSLQDKQISLELSSDQKSLVLPLSIDGEIMHPEATSLDMDMWMNMDMNDATNMNLNMNMDMNMNMNMDMNNNTNININMNERTDQQVTQNMEIEGELSADSSTHFQITNDEDSSYKDPNDDYDSLPTPRHKTNHTWEETAKQLQLNVCVPEMSMYNVPSMC